MEEYTEKNHPSPEALERFLSGMLGAAECRVLVRHLLTGCPVCRQVTGRLWSSGGTVRPGRSRGERTGEESFLAVVD